MMDKKIMTGTVLILIILIGVVGLYVGNSMLDGYKVTVNGRINENLITGWGCEYLSHKTSSDSLFNVAYWYYPWETHDVQIKVKLQNQDTGKVYSGDTWIGSLLNIVDEERFTVDVHFVPRGDYSGIIQVYEVDKGFLGVSEQDRELKCDDDFEVNI